jgi:hypothetical protein
MKMKRLNKIGWMMKYYILSQGERELEFAKTKKKQDKFLFILNYSSACFVLMKFLKGFFFPI